MRASFLFGIRRAGLVLVACAVLSCRKDGDAALAGPEPLTTTPASNGSNSDAVMQQQDAIIRQQDVIIAQQAELIAEIRALRDRLDARGDIEPTQPPVAEVRLRPGQPDPKATYKVPIDGAQVRGPATAKVTIVQWSDFQCPFCSRVTPTLDELMKDYDGKLRHVHMHNPLPMHNRAMDAAIAAEAAGRQGKFWPMYELMFANQKELTDENFVKWAKKLRLNAKRFRSDLADPRLRELIERQQKLGVSLGARGTPAFFVNGRYLSGAQPKESFKALIDEEMQRADGLLAKGVPAAKVYELTIADGRTEP